MRTPIVSKATTLRAFVAAWVAVGALVVSCGTSKPKSWWERSDICPDGAEINREGTDIFCAMPDGRWHGPYATVIEGKPVRAGHYVEGKRHGEYRKLDAQGSMLGAYEDDEPTGTWTYRDSAGQRVRAEVYRGGVIWETHHFDDDVLSRTEPSEAANKVAKKIKRELAMTARIAGFKQRPRPPTLRAPLGVPNGVQGGVQGGVLGGVQGGVLGGVPGGVQGGVVGGVQGGVVGGVLGGTKLSGTVRVQSPTVSSNLEAEDVAASVRQQLPKLRDCYDRALRRNSRLKGTMTMTFQVESTGRVRSVTATGVDDGYLKACSRNSIRRSFFPKPTTAGGRADVRLPIKFDPS